MHLYLVVRGFQDRLSRWVNDVTAQHVDWKADDGKVHKVRIMLRPVQLYEVVFPEPAYEEVLSIIQPYDACWGKLERLVWVVRKVLRLKPVQKLVRPNYKVDNNFVQRVGIGTSKDEFHPNGWEML